MSEFYHRYQSLFDLPGSNASAQMNHKKKLAFGGSSKANNYLPTFTPQQKYQKEPYFANLNRSPALEEFQHSVLPKLNKNYPAVNFNRLKTELEDSNSKLTQQLQNNNSFGNFYQLPKVYAPKMYPQRERILTEGSKQTQKPSMKSRHHFGDVKNININNDILLKEVSRYYPKHNDSVVEQIFPPKTPRKTAKGKRRVMTEAHDPAHSRYDDHSIMARRWEVKILPERQSPQHFQGLISSPKQKKQADRYRQYKEKQKQLFGIKQNQFAFVHSKLQQIKRSEKYYPRGYINSYRDALFRRRKQKNAIEQRRDKLRNMLYEEDVKYGVI